MSTRDSSDIEADPSEEGIEHWQWHVAQLGAREHYAVPRALARRGRLAHFYTDAWCRWGRSLLRNGPDLFRAFANRYHPELATEPVTSFTPRAILNVVQRRFRDDYRSSTALTAHHVDVGRWFAMRIREALQTADLDPNHSAFFGFVTGCYEVLTHLRDREVLTVVDQVSPGPLEHEIVSAEIERWPGWARQSPSESPALQRRVSAEWDAASLVLVNSEWSRSALCDEGLSDEKIIVVPGAYELPDAVSLSPSRPNPTSPLRVLWLGSVVLRKGIQYLVQAAHELATADVEFTIAGALGITTEAVEKAPDNMTFVGEIPRDRTSALYRAADVFVLPTLSDGFGITQVEAMAHGCPVVTTPNCGRVVTDGHDGFVVPPRNADALAEALLACVNDRDRVARMGRAARTTARDYTLDVYAQRLFAAIQRHLGSPNANDRSS